MSRFLIQGLLPIQGIHLVGGPSGVGKTRFILKMLETWQRGEPFFGHASYPLPFVYIAADRGRRDAFATMYQMGMDPKTWPLIAHDDVSRIETALEIIKRGLRYFPGAKVIVVEGLASLMPGGGDKALSNGAVQKFLKELSQFNKQKDTTIIGTVHTAKRKKEEGYVLSREKIMGASAWGGYSNTIITLDPGDEKDVTSPERTVIFMPRNAPTEMFELKFNDQGLLEKVAAPPPRSEKLMDAFLATRTGDLDEFTTKDAIRYFASQRPPLHRAIVMQMLSEAVKDGLVDKLGHGKYAVHEKDPLDL